MATEITMPKLSDTMTEGQLGVWRKSVGERVERGDIIAEVETDKATMDLEAFSSGILLEQRVKAGELVPVGTVIGLIGAAEEATASHVPPEAEPLRQAESAPTETAAVSAPSVPTVEYGATWGVQAAPIVRRRAAELGIDLTRITGSGPGGRIMPEDLQRLVPTGSTYPDAVRTAAAAASGALPLSRLRSAIARTTGSSWQTTPHFYLTREMEMERAERLIRELRDKGTNISLNALIMAAVAAALQSFPALNAGFSQNGILSYPHVNLGFAVALADGLQVPVIKEAETKTIRELTAETISLAEKARQGSLTPDDISGGSFTVSNLGMYNVDSLTSIIVPGQAAIMALGTVAARPVVHNGQLAVARTMTATLSCDHRIIDGAAAAGFINECKRLLEQPADLPV